MEKTVFSLALAAALAGGTMIAGPAMAGGPVTGNSGVVLQNGPSGQGDVVNDTAHKAGPNEVGVHKASLVAANKDPTEPDGHANGPAGPNPNVSVNDVLLEDK